MVLGVADLIAWLFLTTGHPARLAACRRQKKTLLFSACSSALALALAAAGKTPVAFGGIIHHLYLIILSVAYGMVPFARFVRAGFVACGMFCPFLVSNGFNPFFMLYALVCFRAGLCGHYPPAPTWLGSARSVRTAFGS